MSLRKPLGLGLIVGLMAMAFAALPAFAGAAELTDPSGNPLPTETTITGTSTNAITKVGSENLECEKVVVNAILKVNSGGKVEAVMDGEDDSATNCELPSLGEVSVKPTLLSIAASGSSGVAQFEFLVAGSLKEASTSTVSWVSGGTSLHVEGPVTGPLPGEFSGDFELTANGSPVTVD
jgi:hypothetical protein